MKKIHLIIILILLLLSLTSCLPPLDKTTEYEEKNGEFKEYILEKLNKNVNENEYSRIVRGFGISNDKELFTCRYEIIYSKDKIEVYHSFITKKGDIKSENYKAYIYMDECCYRRIYNDGSFTELVSEEKEKMTRLEFLELYEHKEYANYDINLTESKVKKIVREKTAEEGWGYEIDYVNYNIQFEPSKVFHFEVLDEEFTFSNCEINMYEDNETTIIFKGKRDDSNCTATLIFKYYDNNSD